MYTIPLNDDQLDGCDKIIKLLYEKELTPMEIEDVSKQYNIPLIFTTDYGTRSGGNKKLLEVYCEYCTKYFNPSVCDLLLDQGKYSDKELSNCFIKAFYNKKISRYQTKKDIFDWFIGKKIKLLEPYLYAKDYLPFWHKLFIQHIEHKYERYDFFYNYLESNFDITEVDPKYGNNMIHNYINCWYEYGDKRIELLKFMDVKSPKYSFSKQLPMVNKKNQTIYHLLFLKIKKINKTQFKILESIFKNHDMEASDSIFKIKELDTGMTVLELVCDLLRKKSLQFAYNSKLTNKDVLKLFQYDFDKDPLKMFSSSGNNNTSTTATSVSFS